MKQKTNKLNLIIPDRKLKFNMKKDVYKNRITLNLDKVHTQKSFSTTRNNVVNFGLLCTKKINKSVGEKITVSQEIIKTVHVKRLQNFINYKKINPFRIMLDSKKIVEDLPKYKTFKYRFLINSQICRIIRHNFHSV